MNNTASYTRCIKNKCTTYLTKGVDKSNIPGYSSWATDIKHGEIYNKRVVVGSDVLYITDTYTANFLAQWGINTGSSGYIEVIYDQEHQTEMYSASIIDVSKKITYKCVSRKVLKPLNQLYNYIIAERILCNRGSDEGTITGVVPPTLAIHAILSTNFLIKSKLLNPYSTTEIKYLFNNSWFKHVYKIIHPDTKIIYTKLINQSLI